MTIGSGNDRGAVAAGIGIATCLLIAIVFGVAAERSSAADLACRDVVIAGTTLQADLTCSGDGLIIGADDITVDLSGHTIQATCSVGPCPVTSGIDNAGYDHVRIVNGTVKSFERGILLDGADHNKLSNLFGGWRRRPAHSRMAIPPCCCRVGDNTMSLRRLASRTTDSRDIGIHGASIVDHDLPWNHSTERGSP